MHFAFFVSFHLQPSWSNSIKESTQGVKASAPPPTTLITHIDVRFKWMWRDGAKFSLKLSKNKMALSKTSRDGTRHIGGARAWWVVEQFRAAKSVLFHFFKFHISFRRPRSKLSWLEKSCSRKEYHSPKEALHGFVTRSAINADNKGTSLLVPFADDWTDLVLRAHGEAHLRPHAT